METENLLMQRGEVAERPKARHYPLEMSTNAALNNPPTTVNKYPQHSDNGVISVTYTPVGINHLESVDSTDSGVSITSNSAATSAQGKKMGFRQLRPRSVESEYIEDGGISYDIAEPIAIPSNSVERFNATSAVFDDGFGDDGSLSRRHSSFGGITQYKKQSSEVCMSLPTSYRRRLSNDSDSDVSLNSFGQRRYSDPFKQLGKKVQTNARKLLDKMSHFGHSASEHEILELYVKKEVVSPMDPVEAEMTKSIIDAFLTQGQVIATTELEEELDLTQAEPLNHLNHARVELASIIATAFEAVHDNEEVQNMAKVTNHEVAECYAAPLQCHTSPLSNSFVISTATDKLNTEYNDTDYGKATDENGNCHVGRLVRHHPTMVRLTLMPRTHNEASLTVLPDISPDIQPKSFFAKPEVAVKPYLPIMEEKKESSNCATSCSPVNSTNFSPKLRRFSDASPYRRS